MYSCLNAQCKAVEVGRRSRLSLEKSLEARNRLRFSSKFPENLFYVSENAEAQEQIIDWVGTAAQTGSRSAPALIGSLEASSHI